MTWTPALAQAMPIQAPAKARAATTPAKGPANAQRARQTPWPCNGQIMVVSGPSTVQLYTGAPGAGTITFSPVGPAQPLYNAIGIAPSTNIMYGLQGGTQNLIEINPDGSTVTLGAVAGLPAQTAPYAAGGFDGNGNYWVTQAGRPAIYRIDVATATLAQTLNVSQTVRVSDLTFANGFFWGAEPAGAIVRIDPATGTTTNFTGTLPAAPNYGGMFTYGNGDLGFVSNGGNLYRVQVVNPASATPTFTLLSTQASPTQFANLDATSCFASSVDLRMTKTGPARVVPGGAISYSMTVTNDGPDASSGYTVTDTIPPGLENAATTTPGCSITAGRLSCTSGALASGSANTISLTGTAAASGVTSIANTAEVTGNDRDPNAANNRSTATTTVAPVTTPVITSPANGSTLTDNTPTFSGTGGAGDTITLTESGTTVCTTTVGANGEWSCTPTTALPDGQHTVLPTATDPAGNRAEGAPVSLTIDATAPVAPVITSPADGSTLTDNTPAFSGTGDAGDTITLTESGTTVCTTTVGANGQWSCRPTTALPDGRHTILPTATDPAGNRTEGAPISLTIDTQAPTAPVITSPADGSLLTDNTPTFSGPGDAGDTITLTESGTTVCTTTVGANGQWSCTPTTPLPDGGHTITPTATDPAGNRTEGAPISLTIDTQAPTAPVITSPADGSLLTDSTPTFSGTGDAGDTITLTESGTTVCTTTVGANGEWSCTPTTALPDGRHTVLPTSTDPAGNRTEGAPITITIDATAPGAPVITSPADGSLLTDNTPTFSGTGDAGDTVTLTESGTTVCTATVGANGQWSCTPTTPLPDGRHTVLPTATDAAGNRTEGAPISLTIDTQAPTAPVITSPADGSTLTDNTPTFTGTGTAGDTITLTESGTTVCTATVGANGQWSCTPTTALSDSRHTITPTATDPAGNRTEGAPISLTIDATAPGAPVITSPADGSTLTDNTPAFSGTGTPGDTVTLTESGTTVCTATVGANGQWSCTPTTALSDGRHTITPTATDPAGNRTEGAPITVTIDTQAPTAPVITSPADGTSSADNTPTFTGTGTAGDTVTLTESGTTICTTTVGANGEWSCTPTIALTAGQHTIVPTATDPAGNRTAGAPITVTISTTAPTVPVITSPANGSTIRDCQAAGPNATERAEQPGCTLPFAGTGVPGTRITVLEGRKVICTARVNANGQWACKGRVAGTNGQHTFVAVTTGANGATVRSEPVTVTIQSRNRPHHKGWPPHKGWPYPRPHDA
ncbi:Ig-like domain-containing protein [Streptomyces erythrochromogenes]|uniref:Ig-like domain-containing protein n=1 Tax=Streptomyces erythrochromogenes TaxID=285574 RepID=UPI0033FD4C25